MLRDEVLHELRDAVEEVPLSVVAIRVPIQRHLQIQFVATVTLDLGRAEFEDRCVQCVRGRAQHFRGLLHLLMHLQVGESRGVEVQHNAVVARELNIGLLYRFALGAEEGAGALEHFAEGLKAVHGKVVVEILLRIEGVPALGATKSREGGHGLTCLAGWLVGLACGLWLAGLGVAWQLPMRKSMLGVLI